jgi:hypothetical protein
MHSLYQRILGDSFDSLDPILKRIHNGRSVLRYSGYCDIESNGTALARFIACVAGLPSRGVNVATTVTMNCRDGSEEWTRAFGSHRMRSSLRCHRGRLRERLGLVVFTFDLISSANRIDWHLVSARLWPIPIPVTFLIKCGASETAVEGRYTFDVKAHVLGVGMIVHYKGWLGES